jgi:squalene cyclase
VESLDSTSLYKRIISTIDDGTEFIKSQQYEDGLWRDFETMAGKSSEWVTGFVLHAISGNATFKAVDAALRNLIKRQRANGGWSYNQYVPCDSDSSAWILLALSSYHVVEPEVVRKGILYLGSHFDIGSGGFSTYNIRDGIHEFIKCPNIELMAGWLQPHVDVTSVAIQSLVAHGVPIASEIIQKSCTYLAGQKDSCGLWKSYWWKGYAYSTFHALRALSMCHYTDNRMTADALVSNQSEDGGWNYSFSEKSEVFQTAFVILSLLLYPDRRSIPAIKRGIKWLVQQQNEDGSWPSAPILRIPPPMVKNPQNIKDWRNNDMGTRILVQDKGRVFTTAATLWALLEFMAIFGNKTVQ